MHFIQTEDGFVLVDEEQDISNIAGLYELDLNPKSGESEVELPQFDLSLKVFYYDQPQLGCGTRMQFVYHDMEFFPTIKKDPNSIIEFLNTLNLENYLDILNEMIVEYIISSPLQFFYNATYNQKVLKERITELENKLAMIREISSK